MKMKVLAAFFALVFVLSACGGNGGTQEIEPAATAQAILEKGSFSDTLVEATGSAVENYYALDDKIVDYAIYISGSGSTPEGIAVLKVADAKDIANAKAMVEKRLDTLNFQFENYGLPEEKPKLKSPVIETVGNTVIFVVSKDNNAVLAAIKSLQK